MLFNHREQDLLDQLIDTFKIPDDTKRAFKRSALIIERYAAQVSQSMEISDLYKKLILETIPEELLALYNSTKDFDNKLSDAQEYYQQFYVRSGKHVSILFEGWEGGKGKQHETEFKHVLKSICDAVEQEILNTAVFNPDGSLFKP